MRPSLPRTTATPRVKTGCVSTSELACMTQRSLPSAVLSATTSPSSVPSTIWPSPTPGPPRKRYSVFNDQTVSPVPASMAMTRPLASAVYRTSLFSVAVSPVKRPRSPAPADADQTVFALTSGAFTRLSSAGLLPVLAAQATRPRLNSRAAALRLYVSTVMGRPRQRFRRHLMRARPLQARPNPAQRPHCWH